MCGVGSVPRARPPSGPPCTPSWPVAHPLSAMQAVRMHTSSNALLRICMQVPGVDAWRVTQLRGAWLRLEDVLLACKASLCAPALGRPRALRLAAATAQDLSSAMEAAVAASSLVSSGAGQACTEYVVDIVGSVSLADVPAIARTASARSGSTLLTPSLGLSVNLTLSGVPDASGTLPALDLAAYHDVFAVGGGGGGQGRAASMVQLTGLRVVNLASAVPGTWTFPLWAWQFNRSSSGSGTPSSAALVLQDVSRRAAHGTGSGTGMAILCMAVHAVAHVAGPLMHTCMHAG